jgi:hypothetical protein
VAGLPKRRKVMNKLVNIILIVAVTGILACDTSSSITPLSEQFFVKMYAGINEGDQFGNDIIATSDGGFLIAGTSVNVVDDTKEILLIKTDNKGNEVWTYGATNDFGITSVSVAKSVVELPGSYLVGGTLSGVVDQSILIEVDFDGNFINSTVVLTNEVPTLYSNTLSKITVGASGILVSGRTKHPVSSIDSVNFNGFIGLFDAGLSPILIAGKDSHYFGLEGDDFVAGAFEVKDQFNNVGGDSSRFLAFGSSDFAALGGEKDFYYVGLTQTFGVSPGMTTTKFSDTGDQTASYVTEFNDSYWMVGDSDQSEMFLVGWKFEANNGTEPDWLSALNSGRITDTNLPVDATALEGNGVAVQKDNKYVVVGDVVFTAENREIYLARVNGNFTLDSPVWPKTFGTNTSAYTASAVTTLADGSIIVLGTADLEPIKKIIVIKTGPNGEMSF